MKQEVFGDRVLIQAANIYETQDILDPKTNRIKKTEVFKDFSREAKILALGTGEFSDKLKVGRMVNYLPYGGVEVDSLSTKKHKVLVIPADDVFLGL